MRRNVASVRAGEVLKKYNPQIHAIARNATSRLLDQLIPRLGGFASIQAIRCSTKVVA